MRSQGFKISDQGVSVLRNSMFVTAKDMSPALRLPPTTLDRKLYEEVNEILNRIGGVWNKGQKIHIFDRSIDPKKLLTAILDTGIAPVAPDKNPFAYFPTPVMVITDMLQYIQLDKAPAGSRFLEPSAGRGAIAETMRHLRPDCFIDCFEIDPLNVGHLRAKGFEVEEKDFLTIDPLSAHSYSRIMMNPPFAVDGNPLAYIDHILQAYPLLDPGGILVSVVPNNLDRQDAKVKNFRELVEGSARGEIVPLEDRSFRSSGTDTSTCLVVMH